MNYFEEINLPIFDKDIFSRFPYEYSKEAFFTAESDIKYEGYVKIENTRVEKIKKLEKIIIPFHFNYESLPGLSNESREKLLRVQPETLGQASRLAGVRPADISILAIYLHSYK